MMEALVAALGFALIFGALLDAFETVVLPRRVTRQWRLTRLYYRATWIPWSAIARRLPGRSRETFSGFTGRFR